MLTTAAKNKFLTQLVGKSNSALSGSVYIGLSSTAPNADGTGVTEPLSGGYARTLIGSYSFSESQLFGSPSGGEVTNTKYIYFSESTGSWGDPLTHFVLFSSATSTDASAVLAYAELQEDGVAAPIVVSAEKTVVMFRPGKLTIKFLDAE